MTIANTIRSMADHISEAYDTLASMKGVIPEQKNLENLMASIQSLSENTTTMGPWGRIIYIQNNRAWGIALQTEDEFNALCTTGNLNGTITIQGKTFYKYQVAQFNFGANFPTSIPDNFLRSFRSVGVSSAVTVPEGVVSIGNNFMYDCRTYNYAMTLPSTVEVIGSYFRAFNCSASTYTDISKTKIKAIPDHFHACNRSATGVLSLPSTLETIGDFFLTENYLFNQPITMTGIKSIGDYFLSYCTNFQSTVTITGVDGSIGNSFMRNTLMQASGNGSVTLDGTWTSIGDFFLYATFYCNVPISINGNGLTIGNYFLYRFPIFNSAVTITGTLSSIGNYFMSYDIAFNTTLSLPNTITTIGDYFMVGDTAFYQQLTFLDSIQTIGAGFMQQCPAFDNAGNNLVFPSTLTSIGNTFLYKTALFNITVDLSNTSITSVGDYFMDQTKATVPPLLPDTLTTIGVRFLSYTAVCNEVIIPDSVTAIGSYFMFAARAYNKPLTIPASVTSIGSNFMRDCDNFTGPLYISSGATTPTNNYTLSTINKDSPMYNEGVTVLGTGGEALITQLKNRDSTPFRNLNNTGPWGVLYTTEYPNGVKILDDDVRKLYAPTTNFTVGDFSINRTYIVRFDIGTNLTHLSDNFLSNCTSLTEVNNTNRLVKIGNNFLYSCTNFNQPLDLSNLSTFGSNFLSSCTSFNSQITLPTKRIIVPSGFLKNCSNFNKPLSFTSGIQGLGDEFMSGCTSFNSAINFGTRLTGTNYGVGNWFMRGCTAFAQPLSIYISGALPNNGGYGIGFMYNCNNFTGPLTILGTGSAGINYIAQSQYSLSTANASAPMYATGVTVPAGWATALPNSTSSPYRKLIATASDPGVTEGPGLMSVADDISEADIADDEEPMNEELEDNIMEEEDESM